MSNWWFYAVSLILVSLLWACSSSDQTGDLIEQRKKRITRALEQDIPVLFLEDHDLLTVEEQRSVLEQEGLERLFFEAEKGGAMLNEILSISKIRPADIHDQIKVCRTKFCCRMEVYNYALNGTAIVTVEMEEKKKIHHAFYPKMQGDLNAELADLALEIAIKDKMVFEAYGEELSREDGVMQGTKTALNRTKCQRSDHLCAAPTFVKGDKALWAIVDLTDLEVVGVEWTAVGRTGMPVTERSAQNDQMMREFCDQENILIRGDWALKYSMTRSDGMKVYEIKYKGKPLVKSIKTVDWHVSYSERKGFGYSDAIGCPEFSMAAVIAVKPPDFRAILKEKDTVGFALVQDYFSKDWPMPCAYNYRQEFEFYRDGSFRPKIASIGRGCGSDGTYRPVTRIAFAGQEQSFFVSEKSNCKPVEVEAWWREDELFPYKEEFYFARWQSAHGGFWIESNQGQFGDGSRGDKAYFYLTANHKDRVEGEADLPTIGPCCNTDHRQGPEKFINEESVLGEELVFWYVPELKNDGRKGKEYCWAESVLVNGKYEAKIYPCFSGPKFNYKSKI